MEKECYLLIANNANDRAIIVNDSLLTLLSSVTVHYEILWDCTTCWPLQGHFICHVKMNQGHG